MFPTPKSKIKVPRGGYGQLNLAGLLAVTAPRVPTMDLLIVGKEGEPADKSELFFSGPPAYMDQFAKNLEKFAGQPIHSFSHQGRAVIKLTQKELTAIEKSLKEKWQDSFDQQPFTSGDLTIEKLIKQSLRDQECLRVGNNPANNNLKVQWPPSPHISRPELATVKAADGLKESLKAMHQAEEFRKRITSLPAAGGARAQAAFDRNQVLQEICNILNRCVEQIRIIDDKAAIPVAKADDLNTINNTIADADNGLIKKLQEIPEHAELNAQQKEAYLKLEDMAQQFAILKTAPQLKEKEDGELKANIAKLEAELNKLKKNNSSYQADHTKIQAAIAEANKSPADKFKLQVFAETQRVAATGSSVKVEFRGRDLSEAERESIKKGYELYLPNNPVTFNITYNNGLQMQIPEQQNGIADDVPEDQRLHFKRQAALNLILTMFANSAKDSVLVISGEDPQLVAFVKVVADKLNGYLGKDAAREIKIEVKLDPQAKKEAEQALNQMKDISITKDNHTYDLSQADGWEHFVTDITKEKRESKLASLKP